MAMEPVFMPEGGGETIALPPLGISLRVLVPAASGGGGIALLEETTEPGKGPPLHVHHRQTETFHVLEGRYDFLVGERRFAATPGCTLVVPAGAPHAFRNTGDAPGRFLFALTPADDADGFFRALAGHTAGGAMPPPEALAELAARFGMEFVGPPLGA